MGVQSGRLVENPEFLRFSHHRGFRIRACRPYRAQTKGKVERSIRYVRKSFFYGRDFVSDDDLNARALERLDGEAAGRDALVVPVDGAGGGHDAQLREHGVALGRAEAPSVNAAEPAVSVLE